MKKVYILGAVFFGFIISLNSINTIDKQANSSTKNKSVTVIKKENEPLKVKSEMNLLVNKELKVPSPLIPIEKDSSYEDIGDDISLPFLADSEISEEVEYIKLNTNNDSIISNSNLTFKEKIRLQNKSSALDKLKNMDMTINIKRKIPLKKDGAQNAASKQKGGGFEVIEEDSGGFDLDSLLN